MAKSQSKFVFIFLFIVFLINTPFSFAQNLNQTDKGGFYFYWGYNRSAYTKSDLRLIGTGYDFTMKNMTASDNPEKLSSTYLNIKK
ncbi:hypothetical protein CW751_14145 [Brumimicrobium salinarum]|uniref:Uncharacterized protein n=1 Tax=Brumimicrobium salinarum TaxID=2058658 RepID=A0A2I0QZ95_9FLAO|nr:hypothetical protein [Brumimicrobium salinarum]PKR79629.1 hypothetical protein CW751_14145 [Brumimicrobium salinarum]